MFVGPHPRSQWNLSLESPLTHLLYALISIETDEVEEVREPSVRWLSRDTFYRWVSTGTPPFSHYEHCFRGSVLNEPSLFIRPIVEALLWGHKVEIAVRNDEYADRPVGTKILSVSLLWIRRHSVEWFLLIKIVDVGTKYEFSQRIFINICVKQKWVTNKV